jgi:uncharacterized protein (DUF924 family)
MDPRARSVLEFWFGGHDNPGRHVDELAALWFGSSGAVDSRIRQRFSPLLQAAAAGSLDNWSEQPESALALVLVTDQFPRNIHRRTARAFSLDEIALEQALAAISAGFHQQLDPLRATFLLMPLEHAESLEMQYRSVALINELAVRAPAYLTARFDEFRHHAALHREIIRRFGRFPHRNEVLGRTSTPEELAYLKGGGARFGQ